VLAIEEYTIVLDWSRLPRKRARGEPSSLLARVARTRGFAVAYGQIITDVDDNIIRRARELRIDASELARMYPQAPPSAARRSSQARSHRRHSSADRRQCSW